MGYKKRVTHKKGPMKRALRLAIELAGGRRGLANKLDRTYQAIWQWDICPPEMVLAVEALTGVSRSALRPDYYPPETPAVKVTVPEKDAAQPTA